MLVAAVGSASIKPEAFYVLSDNSFLSKLKEDSNARTTHLIDAYESRRLYKSVYQLNYRPKADGDPLSKRLWHDQYPKYRDPKWRKDKEMELENISSLKPGSIAIYCPDDRMNLKQFEMLVQSLPDDNIKYLKNILDPNRVKEMDAINSRFGHLWKTQVFVDTQQLDVSIFADARVRDLSALCEAIIGFPNDITELQGEGRRLEDQVAETVVNEWQESGKPPVPHDVYKELVGSSSYRGSTTNMTESFRHQLEILMETRHLK